MNVKSSLNNIAFKLTICALSLILILSVADMFLSLGDITSNSLVSLEDGWTDSLGQPFALDSFHSNNNPQDIYYTIESNTIDTALVFRCRNMFADVYINGKLIYEDNKTLKPFFGTSPGSRWHIISMPCNSEALEIRISGYSCFSNTHGLIDNIYLGSSSDINHKIIFERLPGFMLSTFLQMLGALMMIIYIFIRKRLRLEKDILYLGTATFFSAQWASAASLLWQFFMGHSEVFHLLEYFSLITIPIPFAQLAAYRLHGKLKTFSHLYSILACINLIITCFCHIFGIAEFHYILTPTHILIGILIPLMVPLALSYTEKKSSTRKKLTGALLLAMFVSALSVALLKYLLGSYSNYSTYVRISIICFITYLTICQTSQVISLFAKGLKADMMHIMARTDYLTGLNNRTAFGEDKPLYEQKIADCDAIGVIQLDINNLKYVNDNLGHEKGDEMITLAASNLKECFESCGECYRMGGDEFLIILYSQNPKADYEECMSSFIAACNEINNTKKLDFTLQIAHGFVLVNGEITLSEAMGVADALMYENKKKLKAEN